MLRYTIALIVATAALALQARTAADFFGMAEADTAFEAISASTRLDMLDYAHSGLTTPSNNRQGGVARIISVSDMSIKLTPATSVEASLDVLTAGKDTILMVIETLPLPQKDSRISFYDTQWRPLKKAPLDTPGLSDWMATKDKAALEQARQQLPFILSTAEYNHETRTLTLTSTMDRYFAPEDTPATPAQMHKRLDFRLNDKLRFTRTTPRP